MMDNNKDRTSGRPFSLLIFIMIVFGLSWPFFIIGAIIGEGLFWIYLFNSIAMIMVAVGTFLADRFVFKQGFANSGLNWGKPIHYVLVIGLAFLLYVVPAIIDSGLGYSSFLGGMSWEQLLILIGTLIVATIIPGFGEEFGWRGYMLPHLAEKYTPRRAVLLHSIIWWAWHIPALATGWIVLTSVSGGMVALSIILGAAVTVFGLGVIFAYIWSRSRSLAVVSVYHAFNNGFKDSLQLAGIGLIGPISSIWSSILMVIIGVSLLWKGSWKTLEKLKK